MKSTKDLLQRLMRMKAEEAKEVVEEIGQKELLSFVDSYIQELGFEIENRFPLSLAESFLSLLNAMEFNGELEPSILLIYRILGDFCGFHRIPRPLREVMKILFGDQAFEDGERFLPPPDHETRLRKLMQEYLDRGDTDSFLRAAFWQADYETGEQGGLVFPKDTAEETMRKLLAWRILRRRRKNRVFFEDIEMLWKEKKGLKRVLCERETEPCLPYRYAKDDVREEHTIFPKLTEEYANGEAEEVRCFEAVGIQLRGYQIPRHSLRTANVLGKEAEILEELKSFLKKKTEGTYLYSYALGEEYFYMETFTVNPGEEPYVTGWLKSSFPEIWTYTLYPKVLPRALHNSEEYLLPADSASYIEEEKDFMKEEESAEEEELRLTVLSILYEWCLEQGCLDDTLLTFLKNENITVKDFLKTGMQGVPDLEILQPNIYVFFVQMLQKLPGGKSIYRKELERYATYRYGLTAGGAAFSCLRDEDAPEIKGVLRKIYQRFTQ